MRTVTLKGPLPEYRSCFPGSLKVIIVVGIGGGYLRRTPGTLLYLVMLPTIELLVGISLHQVFFLRVVDPYDLKRRTSLLIPFPFFLQKKGRYRLVYGSPLPNLQSKVSDTARCEMMKKLDVESPFTSDWRDLAERVGATNDDIRFLESRKDCHESPTQHVINVVEMMKMPLTSLRDIFIDLDRDDIAGMLNLEIGP